MFSAVIMYLPASIIYIFILLSQIKRKSALKKVLLFFLFYIYFAQVIAITFFPIPFDRTSKTIMNETFKQSINIIPFNTIMRIIENECLNEILSQVVGNIALFVPFGFLLPLLVNKLYNAKGIIILGFFASFSIEILQFIIGLVNVPYRISDIDDIILNVAGALLGFMILKIVQYILRHCSK